MGDRESASDGVIAMLSVTLDRSSSEPLVRQLYLRIRELILAGRLHAGARLPSTRKLARDLEVSRTVVLDAFGHLTAEGFLEAAIGAGHFVASLPLDEPSAAAAADPITGKDDTGSIWQAQGEPFDPAWQGVDIFPSQLWGRMLGRGWRRHYSDGLERHWAGLPALRTAVSDHLHALRGLKFGSDEVMITAGNAEALALIARVLRSEGGPASAWVEDPGLGSARQTLQREGITIVPVPVDDEGLIVAQAEQVAPEAAMALVTPARQFPLGMTLSLPRRLSLLSWSRRSGALVVDDDYDGEVRFAGRPIQSLASLDPQARVLTLGSFSKVTFSGLRLGYAAGPRDLIDRLVEARRASYVMVPTPTQAALAEFMITGGFAQHLRKLRTQLTRRRRRLYQFLAIEAANLIEILPQQAGMHLTVRLIDRVTARATDVAIAERARRAGLVLLPLSQQYADERGEQGFLLGYAGWSEHRLDEAAARFVGLLREIAAS